MNIEEILESFNLDPLAKFRNEDPYQMFQEDGDIFLENALTEASTGVTKKNVLPKIWELIKKMFRWIGKAWSRLLGWLKGLIKRNGKPVDEVLETIKTEIPPGSGQTNDGQKISVTIPSDPKSEVNMEQTVEMAFKGIMLQIDSTKDSVTFTRKKVRNNVFYDDDKKPFFGLNQGRVPGQKAIKRDPMSDFTRVMMMISHPEHMEVLLELAEMIKNNTVSSQEFITKYGKSLSLMNEDEASTNSLESVTFTFNQLMEFQKWLNKINTAIERVDIPEEGVIDMNNSVFIARFVNSIASEIALLQMGMNAITSTIRNCYTADASYYETIDTTETLSKFVEKCIKAAVPPKYISYNVYLLSTKKLKGNGKENKPCWGQTRVVFFPENKAIVHKIALSGWGIRANKSEIAISNKFRDEGSSLIALALSSTENCAIIDMERANTDADKPVQSIINLKNNLTNFARDHRIPLDIGMDVHEGNVGYKGNSMVAIDYGNMQRSNAL